MTFASSRLVVLGLLLVSLALLIPGLFLPVLTIRGVLTREGVAQVAPSMLEKGLNDDTMNVLKGMMNPQMVGFVQAMGGDLRKMIIDKLTPEVTKSLQQGMQDVEVYAQTRSIVSAVRNLYDVGSPTPATLILLFSVIVPFTKAVLVGWAFFLASGERRRRTLHFVEAIAKWSMADVFVVGIFIAYLAAQATQTPPGNPNAAPMIKFDAQFGPGFYWFAGYCLFSLASQQFTYRVAARASETTV
jgi:Paraquat-inducible protein A